MTGHTGFKGSWMSVWLEMLGAHVKGYALKPEEPSLYKHIRPHLQKHSSVIADIRDKKRVKKEIVKFQPDFIFHMAAQSLVLESYETPLETFEANALGTANVLDAVRALKKKCMVVIITTDKVYKNPEAGIPFKEEDSLGGHDPYSASKAVAEIISESYRLSFFPPQQFKDHKKSISTARAGNVIGGGDYAKNRLIPDIFRALKKGKTVEVRNPAAVRPWQHVLEPLSGYLALGAAMDQQPTHFSAAFNFGPQAGDNFSVENVVKTAIASWGKGKYKIIKQKNPPHEAGILRLNIKKASSELNWSSVWNANNAISKTIQWYSECQKKSVDQFDLCKQNIDEYSIHLKA